MTSASRVEPEVVLRLDRITKQFGPLLANDAIGFELKRGEIVALLGENGAGKTTLMNILFGHYIADAGEITVFGRPLPPGSPRAAIAAGIGMVHQHFTLAENLTVLDNITLGTEPLWKPAANSAAARRRIGDLAASFGLEVDPDAIVARLSVGERQRVEILKALYRDARVLILDEPTAVLTPQESTALFATLQKLVEEGLSIIFISHKLYEVVAISHRVLVLRGGKLVAERRTAETTRQELAELMVGRPIPEPKVEPQPCGAPQLELRGLTLRGTKGETLLDAIDFTLHGGEIVGVAGVSGNGQAALADLISGLQRPDVGQMVLFGEAIDATSPRQMVARGVARIPEDRHAQGLIADMSIAENVIAERYADPEFCRYGFLDWNAARRFADEIIAAYEVKCPSADAITRLLSGGNMQKLILGRVLAKGPRLILANQPTRGLDIGAVAYVHGRLLAARKDGASILLISEDLDEILQLADRVVVMYRGRMSPALPREAVTIQQLGLMMAGHGFDERGGEAASHAA